MPKLKSKYDCTLVLSHNLFGGKWKMRILWHIIHGDNRFSQLKRAIPDITEKVLYTNLRELEEDEIIYKETEHDKKPAAVFYYLRDEYVKLESVIDSMCEFTKEYAKLNQIEVE